MSDPYAAVLPLLRETGELIGKMDKIVRNVGTKEDTSSRRKKFIRYRGDVTRKLDTINVAIKRANSNANDSSHHQRSELDSELDMLSKRFKSIVDTAARRFPESKPHSRRSKKERSEAQSIEQQMTDLRQPPMEHLAGGATSTSQSIHQRRTAHKSSPAGSSASSASTASSSVSTVPVSAPLTSTSATSTGHSHFDNESGSDDYFNMPVRQTISADFERTPLLSGQTIPVSIQKTQSASSMDTVTMSDETLEHERDRMTWVKAELNEMAGMYATMDEMVNDQGESIDVLESHVVNIRDDALAGVGHLESAKNYSHGSRKNRCYMLLFMVVIIAVLAGFIYVSHHYNHH